jgi:hypothetical protein
MARQGEGFFKGRRMEKKKASDLVVDYTLYPRGDVSQQHISYMVRALEAGNTLPPIIVDKKSLRIVDGVHRWNAMRKFSGNDDILVDCILKHFSSDAEMFLESARLNAAHGSSLTQFDRVKCILRAQELGIPDEDIANALCMTIEKAGALKQERVGRMRVASVEGSQVVSFSKDNLIPLKRTIGHMAGRTLSKRQAEINEGLSGMNSVFHINQLLMLIEGELLDLSDKKVLTALTKLQNALSSIDLMAQKG